MYEWEKRYRSNKRETKQAKRMRWAWVAGSLSEDHQREWQTTSNEWHFITSYTLCFSVTRTHTHGSDEFNAKWHIDNSETVLHHRFLDPFLLSSARGDRRAAWMALHRGGELCPEIGHTRLGFVRRHICGGSALIWPGLITKKHLAGKTSQAKPWKKR